MWIILYISMHISNRKTALLIEEETTNKEILLVEVAVDGATSDWEIHKLFLTMPTEKVFHHSKPKHDAFQNCA